MSNPFATFRKNQNYWMAALVLLAILAFVVAPAIEQISRTFQGASGDNAVVVRWNSGKITVADLRNNIQKHASLVRFLGALASRVMEAGGQPNVPGFFYDPQSNQIQGLGIQASSDEASICETRFLASHAKRLGVEFNDQAIDDFIIAYCDNKISTDELAEILRESTDGRLSNFEVRELLKQELAAMVVRRTATTGFYSHVPGETYQDFLKLNQTAQVEAFPVFVDDYMDEVTGDPDDVQIQGIYDVGINLIANPRSPDAGFYRPYKANVEYVEANLQQWVDREKSKLTEEQLRAEYDRMVELKQLEVPVDSDSPPASGDAAPASPAPADEKPSEDSPSEDSAAEEGSSDASAADSTAAPADAAASEGDAAVTEEPVGDSLQLSPPASDEDASDEGASNTDAAADGDAAGSDPSNDQATLRSQAKVHLVSFLQDENALPPPVVQPPALEQDSDDSTANETAANNSVQVDSGASSDSGSTAADTQPKTRTQTFEEAREEIADALARQAAIPALDEALTTLYEKVMKPHYGAYRQYAAYRDSELEDDEDAVTRPQPPNLKKLAEEAGLTYGQTGLVDGFQLSQTQVGLSNIRQDESGISGAVANVLPSPQLPLFQPLQSSYFDQAMMSQGQIPEFFQYLLWKTEEAQAYRPELSEVREEVVEAWKKQQARILAEAAASEVAKNVKTNDDSPWQNALSTAEQSLIVETDPFTWISRFGNSISQVPKLEEVGGEFMQRVFAANSGSVVVAPTLNRNVFYVTRVKSFTPTADELQQRFANDPVKTAALGIAQAESNQLTQGWYQQLYEDMGVQWQIPLDQL